MENGRNERIGFPSFIDYIQGPLMPGVEIFSLGVGTEDSGP